MTEPDLILIVDDEPNVISSVRRLLRPDGYHLLTASSAEEGLEALRLNQVALVISDNAMPGMTGIEFLHQVRMNWPDAVRIMLTGYADLDSATTAINQGEVYRFVTKPWDPEGLRQVVRQGLDHYRLVQENRRMHALIKEQNAQLTRWNESLQQLVEERTGEIQRKNLELEKLYQQLKDGFINSVSMLIGLVELRNPAIGRHSRRVASFAKQIAGEMGLSADERANVEVAALLHDIGKVGLPDELLRTQESLTTANSPAVLKQHPVLGEAALQMYDGLEPIGPLVKHHHECWNGTGYPSGLRGESIPMGARIIAVADAFDHHRRTRSKAEREFVAVHLGLGRSGPFDPSVVLALQKVIEGSPALEELRETCLGIHQLREGMVLSRDIKTVTGILLLPQGESLKQRHVDKLVLYMRQKVVDSMVHVHA